MLIFTFELLTEISSPIDVCGDVCYFYQYHVTNSEEKIPLEKSCEYAPRTTHNVMT